MMVGVSVDVFMKYVFGQPIENMLETVSYYLMVAIVFLPMASVESEHGHISADLVVQALPKRARNYLYLLTTLVGVLIVGLFAYQTAIDAIESTQKREIQMGTQLIYIWPSRWFLPLGFTLLGLAMLRNAYLCVRDIDGFEISSNQADS